jgi:hypothetical protein
LKPPGANRTPSPKGANRLDRRQRRDLSGAALAPHLEDLIPRA